MFYIYTELIIERQTTSQSGDGIGPGATAGIAITILLIITILTGVVIMVVIVIIRKKTINKKGEKGNKEFETIEESQDYIQMQTCELYALHKAPSSISQEPNLKYEDDLFIIIIYTLFKLYLYFVNIDLMII